MSIPAWFPRRFDRLDVLCICFAENQRMDEQIHHINFNISGESIFNPDNRDAARRIAEAIAPELEERRKKSEDDAWRDMDDDTPWDDPKE